MRRHVVGKAFGRVLREYRLTLDLSQEELAERADLDRTYPSLLERGLRSPSLEMLFRIAEALAIDPAELVAKTFYQKVLVGKEVNAPTAATNPRSAGYESLRWKISAGAGARASTGFVSQAHSLQEMAAGKASADATQLRGGAVMNNIERSLTSSDTPGLGSAKTTAAKRAK